MAQEVPAGEALALTLSENKQTLNNKIPRV